jgi:hypothetical protein
MIALIFRHIRQNSSAFCPKLGFTVYCTSNLQCVHFVCDKSVLSNRLQAELCNVRKYSGSDLQCTSNLQCVHFVCDKLVLSNRLQAELCNVR